LHMLQALAAEKGIKVNVLLTMRRSYNASYLWPFIPFNAKAMAAVLVRVPVMTSKQRPSSNRTRDNTRMPKK
ncbi:MAG: spore germination protein, partial [Paenibacillus macerans]|nr:spore germination protein [Paenibacillus macerans]